MVQENLESKIYFNKEFNGSSTVCYRYSYALQLR